MQEFDAIIIGAGQAGPSLAGRLSAAGQSVAIIERHLVGGTCVNTGCMPTKTLVASAYAIHTARRGADYGFTTAGPICADMARISERAGTISRDARTGNERWLASMPGVELMRGHARFRGPRIVEVGGTELTAKRIFINVGGRAVVPDMAGVGLDGVLTNSGLLFLQALPRHLVIIGGSYIGLEFAQAYRRFGSAVTVVERGERLIPREDEDVSAAIRDILEKEGIRIHTGADCIGLAEAEGGIAVSIDCDRTIPPVHGSHVLLAVGRRPNTDDLGLDAAGIRTDAKGYIAVDDRLMTDVDGIYALGDCNGRGAFTHTAYNDFEIVAANLLDGDDRRVSQRRTGYALYIDPPLGRIGLTQAEAMARGHAVLCATRPMAKVGRARERGETLGVMKIVADAATRRILGAAILGTGGDEAIHGILDMMNADTPIDTLRWAVPIHPTVSEQIPTLLLDLAAPPAS